MKKIKSLLVTALMLTSLTSVANDSLERTLLSLINSTVTRIYVPLSNSNLGSTNFGWDWIIYLRQDALNYLAGEESTERLETLFGELKAMPEFKNSSNEEISSLVLIATENL